MLVDPKTQKYTSPEIQREVEQKGFLVYNYLSFGELIQTARKDFIEALIRWNFLIFGGTIVSTFLGAIIESIIPVFVFLALIYSVLFLYLIGRLFYRSYIFVLVSDVVFCSQGLMIGHNFLAKKALSRHPQILLKYQKYFEEYLTGPSKLRAILKARRKTLKTKISEKWDGLFDSKKSDWLKQDDDFRIWLITFLALSIYTFSIHLFYIVGWILSSAFLWGYIGGLWVFVWVQDRVEIRIRKQSHLLGTHVQQLEAINRSIQEKINQFMNGNIQDMNDFMDTNIQKFYQTLGQIIKNEPKLRKTIEKSKYKDIIDFLVFAKFVKSAHEQPTRNLIALLLKTRKNIQSQLDSLQKTPLKKDSLADKTNESIVRFQLTLQHLNTNIEILEKSLGD